MSIELAVLLGLLWIGGMIFVHEFNARQEALKTCPRCGYTRRNDE